MGVRFLFCVDFGDDEKKKKHLGLMGTLSLYH